jgi:hypothetical protein
MESNEYFNIDFLVDRFLEVKGQDLVTNKKFKEKAAEKKKEAAAAEAGATGAEGAEGATGGEAGSEGGEIIIKEIVNLIKDYPNDYELGKKVREIFRDKVKEEKDGNRD